MQEFVYLTSSIYPLPIAWVFISPSNRTVITEISFAVSTSCCIQIYRVVRRPQIQTQAHHQAIPSSNTGNITRIVQQCNEHYSMLHRCYFMFLSNMRFVVSYFESAHLGCCLVPKSDIGWKVVVSSCPILCMAH